MPIFYYKAKDKKGNYLKGMVDAFSVDNVAEILLAKDLIVLEISSKQSSFYDRFIGKLLLKKVSAKDLVIFFRQMAVMLDANLPLVKSLRLLTEQTDNEALKKVASGLADEVDGGSPLSSAMAVYPKVFSGFYINIVRSGETSGRLSEVMNYLADQREKDYELQSRVKSAMVYPVFILVMLLVVGFIVMAFVIPGVTGSLKESGVELPFFTKVLILVSDFSRDFWWLVLISAGLIFIGFRYLLKTDWGKRISDRLKLKIPIFGTIFRNIYLVRICMSFSTLVRGGVPVALALDVVKDVVDNSVYKEILTRSVSSVDEGNPIADGFSDNPYIPAIVPQMISVGEESGKLDEVLAKVADFYSREVDATVRNLSSLIEPVIMIILGLGVGLFIAAVMMPMWQLSSAF